jgi:hypothetical protein
VSTSTINEVFGAGLASRTDGETERNQDFAMMTVLAPSEHFSTATWFLPSGRSARSAASAAHCEADLDGMSRIRRVILNLSGKKVSL